jgi:hypothetical protein
MKKFRNKMSKTVYKTAVPKYDVNGRLFAYIVTTESTKTPYLVVARNIEEI